MCSSKGDSNKSKAGVAHNYVWNKPTQVGENMGCISLTPVESRKILKQKTTGLVLLLMLTSSYGKYPIIYMVLYIPGGDCRISSINSNSHWPNVHHPVLHQVRDFDEVIMATVLLGMLQSYCPPKMDFWECTPGNFSMEPGNHPRYWKENHLNQTFMTLGCHVVNFQGCTQNGPTKNPGDLHHMKPPLSVKTAPARTSRRCAILPGSHLGLGWLKEARYLLWRYSRKPPKQLGCIVLKKKICWPSGGWYISFSWRNLVYQLSPTSLFFSEESYNLKTRSLHTHTHHNTSS